MKTKKQPKKILDEVRDKMRRRHYSIRTEQSYCGWVKRYIHFHKMQSREDLEGAKEKIEDFLTFLAVEQQVAPSTQNQALNALIFLYKHVVDIPVPDGIDAIRAARRPRLPVVLTKEETFKTIDAMSGIAQLVVKLLYGGGLRLMEALRLRVQDIDFGMHQIIVRQGKGNKDRVTTLPESVVSTLNEQLRRVKIQHEKDLREGLGEVHLPYALARKYARAASEWKWQYVFPSGKISVDPRSGKERRHHIDETTVNKAIRRATKQVGINKKVTAHTFRHSFATHLLEGGNDIRTIQELLGHKDVSTTMIYTHVLNRGGKGVVSPLDSL